MVSNRKPQNTSRPWRQFLNILSAAIKRQRWCVAIILAALVFMGAAQSSLLVVIGPVFKALAQFGSPEFVGLSVKELFPENLRHHLPSWADLTIPRETILFVLPSLVLLFGTLRSFAGYVFEKNQAKFSLTMARDLRDDLFAKILGLQFKELSQRAPAAWMSIIVNDVMALQTRVTEMAIAVTRDSFLVIFGYAALLLVNWRLALSLLIILPLLIWLLGNMARRIMYYARAWQHNLSRLASAVLDVRVRFEFIQAQGSRDYELARFEKINSDYYASIRRSLLLRSGFAPILEFIGFAIFAAAVYILRGSQTLLTGEDLIQFLAGLGLLLKPLKNLGEQLTRSQEMFGTLHVAFDVLSLQAARQQVVHVADGAVLNEPIQIKRLRYRISDEISIELGDLQIAPGKLLAVVGPSGSGKSSLLKALSGLYRADIDIDGKSADSTVKLSNYVSQKPFLFKASLRENLVYGLSQNVSDERLSEALAFVSLGEFAAALPQGLSTVFSPFSQNFSGGQLQRLSLARALLRDKPLLLLDEASSAVDVETELKIFQMLKEHVVANKFAVIAVTHRLGILHLFDEVVFVEGGQIKFRGSPENLSRDQRFKSFSQGMEG